MDGTLPNAGRLHDLVAEVGLGGDGQGFWGDLAAEGNGLAQRGDEDFAVGTGAEMPADFSAHVLRQLVVEIIG